MKKIMKALLALVIVCVCFVAGCGVAGLQNNPAIDATVIGNGGMAMIKGDYLYYVNDIIFRRMKANKPTLCGFKSRAIISSIGGQIVDSTLFVVIAFLFTMPFEEVVPMIVTNVIAKSGYEILVLPLTTKLTKAVNNAEKKFKQI